MADFRTGEAIWKNKDVDQPVNILEDLGIGPDGRHYVKVEGSGSGIPLDEIQYKPKVKTTPLGEKPTIDDKINKTWARLQETYPVLKDVDLARIDIPGVPAAFTTPEQFGALKGQLNSLPKEVASELSGIIDKGKPVILMGKDIAGLSEMIDNPRAYAKRLLREQGIDLAKVASEDIDEIVNNIAGGVSSYKKLLADNGIKNLTGETNILFSLTHEAGHAHDYMTNKDQLLSEMSSKVYADAIAAAGGDPVKGHSSIPAEQRANKFAFENMHDPAPSRGPARPPMTGPGNEEAIVKRMTKLGDEAADALPKWAGKAGLIIGGIIAAGSVIDYGLHRQEHMMQQQQMRIQRNQAKKQGKESDDFDKKSYYESLDKYNQLPQQLYSNRNGHSNTWGGKRY